MFKFKEFEVEFVLKFEEFEVEFMLKFEVAKLLELELIEEFVIELLKGEE